MHGKLIELLQLLGVSEADTGGKVTIEGNDPVVASRHHIGEATAVLLAAFGIEMAALWKMRTGRGQDVHVKVRNAVCQLAAFFYARQNGLRPPYEDPAMAETTDFFRCKDGRWVYIVCSIPHLRNKASAVLRCQPTRQEFITHCGTWNALDLEEAIQAAGDACAMVRTRAEWLACEQGKYIEDEPLIRIEKIGDSPPEPPSSGGRPSGPLSGVRVIDNTHIYAGPYCGRIAADAGADVLHIAPAQYPDPPTMLLDTNPGKRDAWCNLGDPAMTDAFWRLVKGADVWLNSYMTLDRRGVAPRRLAEVRPGIVCVEFRCFGFRGPWAARGGFEQHAQSVTGFAVNEGSADAPQGPPTYLLNDAMCALLGSIGMTEALRRRARDGGSYSVQVTLSKNCSWLQDFGLFDAAEIVGAGLAASVLDNPGLNGRIRREFELPLVKSAGTQGEVENLPLQVEFSEIKLAPRHSGNPNGSSRLEWLPRP
ncbi:MAG: CoA transferase [Reyranella sp.]|nr:CoA transferase [Reyranella sp.]